MPPRWPRYFHHYPFHPKEDAMSATMNAAPEQHTDIESAVAEMFGDRQHTASNLAYWVSAQVGRGVPVAIGAPGVAKTELAQAFAESLGYGFYCLQLSLLGQGEVGGFPSIMDLDEAVKLRGHSNGHHFEITKCSANVPMRWACEAARGKFVLLLDEMTTCPAGTQGEALQLCASRRIGDYRLPDDTIIIGACNPPEMAANGMEFEDAMANRLIHLQWQTPVDEILRGYGNGFQYEKPRFPILPADWKAGALSTGALVQAFHKHLPGRLEQVPSEKSKRSGAWPSPRTWEYLGLHIAAVRACKLPRAVELTVAEGCVGTGAALEFFEYIDNLDLPEPEPLIQRAIAAMELARSNGHDAEIADWPQLDRGDKVMAMIGACTEQIVRNNSAERWEAGMLIIEHAARTHMECALNGAHKLAASVREAPGARFPAQFVNRLFPKMTRALEGFQNRA